MSGRESIPQWNGTDVRADDKPKPKPKKEKQAPEDRTQRKISSFLKSGHKKRPASTERDESVVTAPKRVATEEEDAVDENQNLHSLDPKDPEGGTDKIKNLLESDTDGSREDEDDGNGLVSGDRSNKEAWKSKALDTGNKAPDSQESPEDDVGDDDNILFETSQEKEAANPTVSFIAVHAEKPQTSSKPQQNTSTRPKRALRNTQDLKDVVESDYEVKGDDPQWTAVRRQNRILRHGERLKLQPGATASPAVALSGSGKVPLEKVV